jgi:hypothetical protein
MLSSASVDDDDDDSALLEASVNAKPYCSLHLLSILICGVGGQPLDESLSAQWENELVFFFAELLLAADGRLVHTGNRFYTLLCV